MKKSTIVIVLVLMISVFSCSTKTKNGITVVSIEEMQTLIDLENVQLVDVRTPAEHKAGHISNSQNIDFNSPTFEDDITKLDKEKPVILYCQRGARSAKCADKLLQAGFKKIYDLKGGFSEWEHVDLDIKL
ncbi:rhodanese-like domain-containing protein [Lacinutrix sp. Bg11-31]|uniref:rhodanese-like domain-containing protein n=1 Tax=Lacinutrix sp. Bg11-31 TaxID=2057808 RepID=UPI000C30071C|nr:rhodanese-like domain-containing protein [Lacinutrix sp. Bg11-31]AUC80714.1 rhodanese-like domain-containing protein [Lacinutrix sp. Bg11-31]